MSPVARPRPLPHEHVRIVGRPNGFYWRGQDSGREYGPFATLLKAVLDLDAKGRKEGRRRRLHRFPDPQANGPNHLNATSRAQLGPDEDLRAYRPQADDASVEDPLHDWPDEDR